MPVEKSLEAQMIVMETIERAGEIRAWATKVPALTLSNLLRESLDIGWPRVEQRLRAEHGKLTPGELWSGMLASVPKARRDQWAKDNPMPRERRSRASAAA